MIIRNVIKYMYLRLKNRTSLIASYRISRDVRLEERIRLYEGVYIGRNCKVGRYTYINPNTFVDDNVEIGRYCSISRNCMIGLGGHRLEGITTHPIGYSIVWNPYIKRDFHEHKKTIIGNDVWIGAGAIILNGLTIGNGAVIGAGAVVTRSISDYAVVVGVPAREIKHRKEPKKVKGHNWWELTSKEALKVVAEEVRKNLSDYGDDYN